ncbi:MULTISPECIES: tRNA (guanosine(46)-N7)-methyltransferase TrmB [Jeotgalicoccus]|uniref:tRNA (guanine-N(7)-)-methyltransferase n=1 Tax=Jeotgalicoccus nanhaiensis TaxID=568603 RepID=A0ABR9XZ11_9STAP|nr:tRNA (guanosine(46)-N7)-methyltransferase TrmB [Jeotgalicoccus nanhaiensis]MBF0754112.1 tRNA (guanosine(46)-N7)-methyltransferase TrmB [Jeotgalicoccus nanhaiensis]TFU61596.1 tRNA (guanosine(46)-N7)-methyltransferase TrmB [Jeotgalicoccus nanhaiensis]
MRMRNKPWAIDYLESNDQLVDVNNNYSKKIKEFFSKDQPLHIEVGTGMGTFITTLAQNNPDINYVGIEIDKNVMIRVTEKVVDLGLENVRLVLLDANKLMDYFNENEVDKVYLNFSDPWPKNRHAKRRLTHSNFLSSYKQLLKENTIVEFKTDNRGLFEFSLISMNTYGMKFENLNLDVHADEPETNIRTEYEEKFSQRGHKIYWIQASF